MAHQPTFKDFVSITGMSGFRQVDGNGNPQGIGFASREDVLHFYPDAQFVEVV